MRASSQPWGQMAAMEGCGRSDTPSSTHVSRLTSHVSRLTTRSVEGAEGGGDAAGEGGEVVAAFEEGDEAAGAEVGGEGGDVLGHPGEAGFGEAHARQGVGGV